ncbi:MAG: glycosyltransferase [Verrucomicrobiota bacterium]
MKVLHLSTLDHLGGAFIAARRLHGALREREDIDSEFCVAQKHGDTPDTVALHNAFSYSLRRNLERLPLKLTSANGIAYQSLAWLPNQKLTRHVRSVKPDIVHLQWTQNGFVPLGALTKFDAPLVWTFHDMWGFTGMYHHEYGEPPRCAGTYDRKPEGMRGFDVDAWVWKRKQQSYHALDVCGIVPSQWMAEKARSSSLWKDRRLEVIPNGIDTDVYKPADRAFARKLFNLPPNANVVLFGAMFADEDKNKGFGPMMKVLEILKAQGGHENLHLAVFGIGECPEDVTLPFPASFFGVLRDEASMAALYSAADVMVVPSLQESFGLTACEALSCGTPVACFNTSGLRDIVDHEENGYRAKPFDPADLASGIAEMLESRTTRLALGREGREKVEREFDLDVVAARHHDLYRELAEAKKK